MYISISLDSGGNSLTEFVELFNKTSSIFILRLYVSRNKTTIGTTGSTYGRLSSLLLLSSINMTGTSSVSRSVFRSSSISTSTIVISTTKILLLLLQLLLRFAVTTITTAAAVDASLLLLLMESSLVVGQPQRKQQQQQQQYSCKIYTLVNIIITFLYVNTNFTTTSSSRRSNSAVDGFHLLIQPPQPQHHRVHSGTVSAQHQQQLRNSCTIFGGGGGGGGYSRWIPQAVQSSISASSSSSSTSNIVRSSNDDDDGVDTITTSATTMSDPKNSSINSSSSSRRRNRKSPLSMSLLELSEVLNGSGRAQLAWDCYRNGLDPTVYFSSSLSSSVEANDDSHDDRMIAPASSSSSEVEIVVLPPWKFPSRRRNQTLGMDALQRISQLYSNNHHHLDDADNTHHATTDSVSKMRSIDIDINYDDDEYNDTNQNDKSIAIINRTSSLLQQLHRIDTQIAKITHVSQSSDGTMKLLITLCRDGAQIETVLIPFYNEDRTTVCISSQVGCQQQCTFCATGTMGKTRSLSSDEIIVQLYYAQQMYYDGSYSRRRRRTTTNSVSNEHGNHDHANNNYTMIPPISNVVFMGMGEPSDNAVAVNTAIRQFTTRELFQLSASKITVSTIAPTPQSFLKFVNTSCVLAWSVHAASDSVRNVLVPTTRHTMIELRQGLIDTLLLRPRNYLRTVMIEVVLINDVNDSVQHANDMALFVREIVTAVPGCKLMVNLIPYNEIHSSSSTTITEQPSTAATLGTVYRKPSIDRVRKYQAVLWSLGVYTHIRGTRGDDESAACGQLVTMTSTKMKQQQQH